MTKIMVRLLVLVLMASLSIMSYASDLFYLTDTQGNQHEVTMQMLMVENGQLLSDGNYKTQMGTIIKVQKGRIVSNGQGDINQPSASSAVSSQSNPVINQSGTLNSQPGSNTVKPGGNVPVYPLPLPPPSPIVQQPNVNTPMMSLPSNNNIPVVNVPQNPNTPMMNQIAPIPPSQQAGAPGL